MQALEAIRVDAMVLVLQTVDVQELIKSSRAFSALLTLRSAG